MEQEWKMTQRVLHSEQVSCESKKKELAKNLVQTFANEIFIAQTTNHTMEDADWIYTYTGRSFFAFNDVTNDF